jgi:eukaryotic-like serine/threonine-protein kinase
LSDVAVTQKLLRMVNSSMYRGFGGGVVTTVSRAIQLLGTAAVRTAAASLPLFGPCKNTQVARLLDDMALAHFAGTVARELSGLWGLEAEEAFVCGCFHRLGRMLLSCHFPAEAAEIARLSTGQLELSHQVERQVIGLDYEALGRGVAMHWGLPDVVVHSMRAVAHPVATPVGHPEVLRTLSALATELARAWMMPSPEHRHTATTLAAHGYAKALGVTVAKTNAAVATAAQSTQSLLQSLGQDLRYSEVACRLGLVAAGPMAADEGTPAGEALMPAATVQRESTGDAALATEVARTECQELLAAGVQALSGRLLESFKLNTLVLEVLTTLQRAAGFRQVIFCVREAKTYALVGRIAVGASPNGDTDPGRLHIAMDDPSDPFAAAVFKGDDLWLPDLPAHALNLCKVQGTLGMLLLPLQLKGQPLGLIYADFGAEQAAPIARLGSKELALMGTLRNQVVLAFRQR